MSYQYFFPTGDSAWVDDNVTEQNIFDHYSKKRPEFYPGYTYMSNLAPPAEDVSSQSLISDIFTDPYSTMVMNAPARMQLPITVSNALLTATPEQMKDPAFIQHIKDGIAEMPQELQKHTMREVHNLLNSGEYLGAGAEFAKVAVESISSALGYITPTLAASGLATTAATPIAGVATATSFTAIELLSENLTEILQDPDSTLEDIEKALPKTLAATAAQTAAEMTMLKVFGLLPGTKALFRKALNPATGKTAIKSQTAIKGINALKKAGSSVPVRLGTSAVGEGSTEVLQHLLTQWQAGKEVDFAEEDHMWEIYENFAGGFFGGAGLRGAGMGLEKMKERTILGTTELEKDKERRDSQKEAADAANREENNLRTKRLENESQRLKKLRVERESRINIGVEEATERFEVQEQDIHNIAYERRINSRDAGFAQKISEMFPGKSSIGELNSNEKFLLYEHLKEHQVQGSGVDHATTTESREAPDDAPSIEGTPIESAVVGDTVVVYDPTGKPRTATVTRVGEGGSRRVLLDGETEDILLGGLWDSENVSSAQYVIGSIAIGGKSPSVGELTDPQLAHLEERTAEKVQAHKDSGSRTPATYGLIRDLNALRLEQKRRSKSSQEVIGEPKDGKLESGDLSRFGMPGRVRGLNVSSIKLERLLAIKESLELVSAGPYGASAEESVAARNDLRVVEEWIKYRTDKAVNTGRDEQVLSSFSSYSDSEMSDVLSFLRKKFKRHKVKAKALTKDMLSDVLKIETYEDSIGTSKFNSVVNELVDRGIVSRESTDAFLLRMANSKNQRDSHEALEIFNYQSQVDKSGYTAEEAEYLEQRFEEMYNEKSYLVVSDSFVNQRNGRILDLASELKRFPSFEDVKKYTDIQSEETYNSTVSELERDGIVYIDDTGAVTLTRSSDDSLFKYDYSAVEKRKFAVRNSEGKIISLHDSREAALDKTKELNNEYGGFEVISNNGVIVKTFHGENAKGRAKDFVNNNRQKYTVVKDRSIVQRGLSKTQADNMVRELRREAGLSGADARRRVLSSPEVGGLRFGLNEKDYLVELPAGYSSSGRSESLFLVEESRSSSGGDYSGTSIVGVRDSLEAAANRAAQLASMRKNSAESIRGKVVKGLREGKTVEELLQENIEGLSSREASRRAKEYERLRRSRLEQEAINNTDGRLTEDQALRLETLLERESAVLERNRDIGRSENPLEDPSRQELRDIRSDPRDFVGRTIARETREGRRKEPARQVDVSKDPRVKEALKELRKKFKQAGIDDVSDLKIVPTLTIGNILRRGRLKQGTGFIEIALDLATKNIDKDTTSEEIFNIMLETLGHETVHVYSENGWITPKDRKRLVKFAKKNKWPNSDRTIYSVIRDTYAKAQETKGEQHLSEERIDEEAMAFVIQLYINERGWGVNKVKSDEKIVKGPIAYIINKIAKYMKGLSNYFRESGFESIEDVVDRFLPGEISSDSVAKVGKASARLKDRVRGSFYASGDSIAGKRYKTGKGVGGRFVHEDADGLYELPEIVRMKDIEKAAEIKGFDLSKIDKKYLQERRIGQGTDSKVQDLARDPRSMRKLHNEILGVVDVYSPLGKRPALGDQDSVMVEGGQLITDEDAHAAAQTQRGVPEDVMDEITAGADRAGFPAVLGDLLEHVGDISNRAQQRSGIAIVNVREKVDKVLRFGSRGRMSLKDDIESSRRSNAEFDLLPSLEPELRRLDDAGPEVWKSAGFKTRSDLWDAFREKHPNLKDLISEEVERQVRSEISPLSRYVDAHETHNVALTEMGKLGKDMAIHLGKGEYDALIEKARVLDGLVYEYERLKSEGRRDEAEAMRLRPAPTPRAEATTLKDQDSIYIEAIERLPSPISDDAYMGGPFSSKLPDDVRANSRIEGDTVTVLGASRVNGDDVRAKSRIESEFFGAQEEVSRMGPGLWFKRISHWNNMRDSLVKDLSGDKSLYWKYEGGREFTLWAGDDIEYNLSKWNYYSSSNKRPRAELHKVTVNEANIHMTRHPGYQERHSPWKYYIDDSLISVQGDIRKLREGTDTESLHEAEDRMEKLLDERDFSHTYPLAEGARKALIESGTAGFYLPYEEAWRGIPGEAKRYYERDDSKVGDEFVLYQMPTTDDFYRADPYTYTFGKDGSNDMSLQKVDGIATEEHKLGKRPEFKDQDSISIGRQESFLPEGRRNDDISFNDSTTKRITKMLRDARLKKIRDSHYKVETDDENRRIVNQNIKYYRDRYNAAINDGVSSMNDVISRASSSFRKNGNVVWLKEFNLFLQDMEAEGVPSNDLFKLKNDIYNEMNISSEKITIGSVQRNLLLHSDHVEYDQGTLERETPFSSPEGIVEEIRNSDLKRLPKSSNLNGTTAIFLDGPGYTNPIAVFIKPVNFRDMAIVEIVSNQDYGKRNMEYSGENSPPLHGVDATAETAMFFYNRGKGDGRQVQQVLPLGTQNRWKDHDSIAYNPSNYSKEENEILGRVHSPGGKGYIKSILGAFNNDDGKSALAKAKEKFIHSHSAVEKSGLLLREKMRGKGEILEFSEMAFADVILAQRANGVLAAALKYGVPVIERALNWRLTKAETGSFELRNDPDLPQVYTKKYGGFIDIINPLMDEIGVRDNLMHKFFVILVSRRARRLQSMGMRVPEGVDDSYHGVADKFLEDNPEMSVIIDNFMEWNNKLLDYAVDAGLLSESLGAELKRTMDYVSFSREFNEEGILDVDKLWQGTSEPVRRREGRMQDPRQPEKFAEGTEGKLKDFLSSVASNAYSLIQESMNNMASEAVIEEQRKLYGEESVVEAGAVDANGVKRNKVKDVLNPNSITYRDKGVKRTFVVPDGAVAGAMKGTIGVKDPFVENFLTSFSRILREGVTRSPGFIWRNTVKDAQMLYMLVDQDVDEQFLLPFKSIGNAVKNIFRGQNYFTEEFLALESTGSAGGFELGTVHNPTAKGLQKLMNENSRGEISINPIKTFYKIWDGLGVASAKAETSAREEIYKLTMARTNGNVKEATIQAIEFLNFNRRGGNKNFQNLLKLSPFLSAGINGVDVILRKSKGEHTMDASLTKSQVRKRALTRMAYLSAIGFTQAALWGELDDEEWKSYAEDIVLTNTLIPIFGTDASIAFPAPFELGFFTHTLPTLLYRTLKGDVDYNLSKSLRKGAFHSIKTLPSVGLPQAIAPLVGIGGHPWSESRGWNPFLESPVIPEHIPPGRMAYTTETSPIARGISSVIGGSPMKWEHLYLYGGTMAVNFMALADSIVRVIPGLEPEDEIPGDWTRDLDFWLKDPNISAIVKKASDSGQMQRFYEKYEAAEELAYAIRTLNIENVSKSREVKDENWKLHRKTGTLRRAKSVLERYNKRIKKIKYRKDLSGGEKQERIDRIKAGRKKYLKKIEANTSDLDMKVWGFGKYRD